MLCGAPACSFIRSTSRGSRILSFTSRASWVRGRKPGRAWCGRAARKRKASATAAIASEEEFVAAGQPARLAYLRILRASEPDRARALVERVFAEQPAGARAELLDVLRNGLGPADLPFIEAARSDRAQTVRDKATALIERIPGTDAYEAKLARLQGSSEGQDRAAHPPEVAVGFRGSAGQPACYSTV